MKKAIQNIAVKISVYSLCLFLLSSCKKTEPTPTKPTITSFSPASGVAGTVVTITGTNFSGDNTIGKVKFGGVEIASSLIPGTGTKITQTTIIAKVPDGAGTGYITVELNGEIGKSLTEFVMPTTITSFTPKNAVGGEINISGTGFSAVPASNIVKFNGVLAQVIGSAGTGVAVIVPVGATTGKISVQVGGGTPVLTATDFTVLTGSWAKKTDFGGVGRISAFSFAIGTKGYIGGGKRQDNDISDLYDFWEYEPTTNIWTQKANIGASPYTSSVGFTIGGKGYLVNDYVWEYDPSTNAWVQKTPFSGGARIGAVGFAIGNKGYVGTGYTGGIAKKDFWEYNPATDIWVRKADVGIIARGLASSFVIGTKGYIVGGGNETASNYVSAVETWEYDQTTNIWIQKANIPASSCVRGIGYSIGNKGYVSGYRNGSLFNIFYGFEFRDVYEYDQITNIWTSKASSISYDIQSAAFIIGNKAYVGTGFTADGNTIGVGSKAFWEFTP